MPNEIVQTPDNISRAGHEFSYASWPADSRIQLANVRWNSDYRDVVDFESKTKFLSYIQALPSTRHLTITRATYAKPFQPFNLPISFNEASKYNYIVAQNPAQYGHSKDFPAYYAYFITSVEYVNPGTTRLTVQLDAWQTYGYDVNFGVGYVERGHIGLDDRFSYGEGNRDLPDLLKLTTPEGFDLGGEYTIRDLVVGDVATGGDSNNTHSVIVTSTVDVETSSLDKNAPSVSSAKGSVANGIPNGANLYFFETAAEFVNTMADLSDYPWITQGFISATIVPPLKASEVSTIDTSINGLVLRKLKSYPRFRYVEVYENWFKAVIDRLPPKYRDFKKFATYPYALLEITLLNGAPLVVKPERLRTRGLHLGLVSHITPPNPRIMLHPVGYNSESYVSKPVEGRKNETGEYLDFATGITNLPQTSVVNNSYLSYMASNARSIAFQHQSADWSQQRALRGADVSYQQSTGAINAAAQSADITNQTDWNATQIGNTSGAVKGVLGTAGNIATGAAVGGPAGAGMAAAGGVGNLTGAVVDVMANNAQAANRMASRQSLTGVSNAQSAMVRDTNFGYANFAANGDYQNAIAAINAKTQDAQMIQPTVSGQVGGEAFNLSVDGGFRYRVRIKTIDDNVMDIVAQFWARYGYAINRFVNFQRIGGRKMLTMMKVFTYWKLKELQLGESLVPEQFKQTIRGIFEMGVTVWRGDSIGFMGEVEPFGQPLAPDRKLERSI